MAWYGMVWHGMAWHGMMTGARRRLCDRGAHGRPLFRLAAALRARADQRPSRRAALLALLAPAIGGAGLLSHRTARRTARCYNDRRMCGRCYPGFIPLVFGHTPASRPLLSP